MLDKFRERKLARMQNFKNADYKTMNLDVVEKIINNIISEVERANTVTECNEALIAGTKLLYFKKGLKSQAIRFEDNLNNPKEDGENI